MWANISDRNSHCGETRLFSHGHSCSLATVVVHELLPLHPLYNTCVASQYVTGRYIWCNPAFAALLSWCVFRTSGLACPSASDFYTCIIVYIVVKSFTLEMPLVLFHAVPTTFEKWTYHFPPFVSVLVYMHLTHRLRKLEKRKNVWQFGLNGDWCKGRRLDDQ